MKNIATRTAITLAIIALLVPAATAQTFRTLYTDTSHPYRNPLYMDGELQGFYYLASSSYGNLESRGESGQAPIATGDDQSTFIAEPAGDPNAAIAYGWGQYFANIPTAGDVIGFVSFWSTPLDLSPTATALPRLHLCFDSLAYDGVSSQVFMGRNDSVVVMNPTLKRSRSSVLVQWHDVTEPLEILQGDGPSVPGAIQSWNVYRSVGRPDAREAQFVTNVPANESAHSIVDYPGVELRKVFYGVVPVFRAAGVVVGPQGEGIELRHTALDGSSWPALTFGY